MPIDNYFGLFLDDLDYMISFGMTSEIEDVILVFKKILSKLHIIINICDELTSDLKAIKDKIMTDSVIVDVDE